MKGPNAPRRFLHVPSRTAAHIRRDLDAELRLHFDLRTEELIASGMSADAARREAEREFGDVELTRRYCEAQDKSAERETRRSEWLGDLRDDLRRAVRAMLQHPAYTVLVAATLALGVGANTAVFGVVSSVLLRPLPYAGANRLVAIDELNIPSGNPHSDVSAAEYLDWATATKSLAAVAAAAQRSLTFSDGGTPEQISGRRVSANFLDAMGIVPAMGRGFVVGEDRGVHHVIILTDGLWRRLFGADPSIIGRRVTLSGDAYTVVGVLRPNFMFPGATPQFLIPVDFATAMSDVNRARNFHFMHAFGRLRSGATTSDALAELRAIAHRAEVAFPSQSTGHLVTVQPLHAAIVGDVAPTVMLLAGAATFVLLIACANVANLALARALGRRREIAIRIALGAGRGRVVRQVLTESALLALLGGIAGALVAFTGTPALVAAYPRALPPGFSVRIDAGVFAFALFVSALAGIGFGLLPAMTSGGRGVASDLRDGGRGATLGRSASRARHALIITQVALAMVLLIGAGLLVRTLGRLQAVDLGFAPAELKAVGINLPNARYSTKESVTAFWRTLLDRTRREPGYAQTSIAGAPPLLGGSGASLVIQGRETGAQPPGVRYGVAMDGYFGVIGTPMRAGREFREDDRTGSQRVVVINESLARQFWPDGNAIGANIRLGPDPAEPWSRVIGVVADFRNEAIDAQPEPMAITFGQQDTWTSMFLVVRTPKPAKEVKDAIGRLVRELDPALAVQNPLALPDVVSAGSANRRFALSLLGTFALVALAVAIVGLYGVIAYGVATRRHEFGVRLALGATPCQIIQMVLNEGARLAAIGLVLGVGASLVLTRFLSGLLFEVRALDGATFASVFGLLAAAALGASWLPARRAAHVDPSRALRDD